MQREVRAPDAGGEELTGARCVRCAEIAWDGGCFHDTELPEDNAATFRDMLVALMLERRALAATAARARASEVAGEGAGTGVTDSICFADLQLLERVKTSATEVAQAWCARQQQQRQEQQRWLRQKRKHAGADHAHKSAVLPCPPPPPKLSLGTLLRKSLVSLERDGVLFLSDVARDEYSLLTFDGVLAPALVRIIREGRQALMPQKGGLTVARELHFLPDPTLCRCSPVRKNDHAPQETIHHVREGTRI